MREVMRPAVERQKSVDRSIARASETFASVDAVTQVRIGYPVSALKNVADLLGVPQIEVTVALRFSRSDIARRAREGRPLTPAAPDRLYRAFKVIELAAATLGDEESARGWLRHEHPALGGANPLSLMDTSAGYELIQDELARIAHGIVA